MHNPPKPAIPSLRVALAAAALGLLWLAMLVFGTGGYDDEILHAFYAGGHPGPIAIATALTTLGSAWVGIPVTVGAVVLLLFLGRRREALAALLVIAVGRLLVEAQKYAIGRLRPEDEPHLAATVSPAFPSGHSANSMIVCLTLALLFFGRSRWRGTAVTIALLLAFCIGLSRLMLGVHWPTDVIGGWAFGLLWVIAALPLAERLVR